MGKEQAIELILSFIRQLETGRSSPAQQYGTIIGHFESKLSKSLFEFTIDEIIAASDGWRKQFGVTSGAAGAYQIIKSTLVGLKKSCQLSGKERFAPALQDRLGRELLKRRGLTEFFAGTMRREAFGNSLAKEWASLPVLSPVTRNKIKLKRGQSFYDGFAGNSALTTADKFEGMLDKALELASVPDAAPLTLQPARSRSSPLLSWLFSLLSGGGKKSTNALKGTVMSETVSAPVKSAWTSKINWTMALGVIFNIFAMFGLDVPDDVRAGILTGGNSIVLVVGWVLRTWFTSSIVASSAKKL